MTEPAPERNDSGRQRRLLVIRFSSLGDLILLTSIFPQLRQAGWQGKIDVLTSVEFADVFAGNPEIDRILTFDRKNEKSGDLMRRLWKEYYDVVIDAHSSLRSRIITKIMRFSGRVGAVHRVSKKYCFRYSLVHFKKIKFRPFGSQRDLYAQMVADIFNTTPSRLPVSTHLYPAPEHQQEAAALLGTIKDPGKPLICIAPYARHQLKEWGTDKFMELAGRLSPDFNIVISAQYAKETQPFTQKYPEAIDASGLSILASAAVYQKCGLVVCNDSASTHFAEAVKTPALVIFGPTTPAFGFSPYLKNSSVLRLENLPCCPCTTTGKGQCRLSGKDHRKCMESISVDEVETNIRTFFAPQPV